MGRYYPEVNIKFTADFGNLNRNKISRNSLNRRILLTNRLKDQGV